jgi:mono/diheme cytochrome c family protein
VPFFLGTDIAPPSYGRRLAEAATIREKGGIMKTLKLMSIITVLTILVAGLAMFCVAARANAEDQFDAAATYKAKCVACHGPAAEKKFDATLADADLVQIVLKGKKMEKPPNMPGYEEKGVSEEQAKALVAHMKSLKK